MIPEKKQSDIHKYVKMLPPPPPDEGVTTPTKIIAAGTHTEEELITVIELLIIRGHSVRSIAEVYKIELTSLSRWLSHPQRSARTRTAMLIKADYHADQQLKVLTDLQGKSCTKEDIILGTRISEAHRWAARTGNPQKYGEKLDVTSEGKAVVQVNLGSGIAPPEASQEPKYIDITHTEEGS